VALPTGKVIERSPASAIAIYVTRRDDAWFESADRTFTLSPGNVLVSYTDKPFARGSVAALRNSSSR
jgi:hypothetical protein